jgi:hypothetical protein
VFQEEKKVFARFSHELNARFVFQSSVSNCGYAEASGKVLLA